MQATVYQHCTLNTILEDLKKELDAQHIKHHISWISHPPLPFLVYGAVAEGTWLDLLEAISDFFPVVCLYAFTEGVLYVSIMARYDWLQEKEQTNA